jgi:hypothetical protein
MNGGQPVVSRGNRIVSDRLQPVKIQNNVVHAEIEDADFFGFDFKDRFIKTNQSGKCVPIRQNSVWA